MDMREVPEGSALDMFHFEMWVGFLSFSLHNDECRAAFEADTNTAPLPLELPKNGLEKMIDDACGVPELRSDYMANFARWVTANYWGDETDISPSIAKQLSAHEPA